MARVTPDALFELSGDIPCVRDWLPAQIEQHKIRWHFVAVTAACYAIAALVVLGLYASRNDLPFMYLAAGIYWAGLLLTSRREWLAIVPTIFFIQLLMDLMVYGAPIAAALVFALSKTLEGLCGAVLLRYLCSHTQTALTRTTYFVLIAGALLPSIFAIPPALVSLSSTIDPLTSGWAESALVQASGTIIVTPAAVSAWLFLSGRVSLTRKKAEAITLALIIVGVSSAVFLFELPTHPASIYLVTPGLFWSAARFGSIGAATCNIVLAAFASAGVVNETAQIFAASSHEFSVGLCLYLLINTATSIIIGATADDRNSRINEIERGRRQIRELAVRQNRKEDEFRAATARLVHDSLGQTLALARIKLDLLGARMEVERSDDRMLIELKEILDEAIRISRSITANVASSVHEGGDFQAALQQLLSDLMSDHQIDTTFECDQSPELDKSRASSLFRCTRELLVNVVKHAEASRVKLSIAHGMNALRIKIRDNGRGIKVDPFHHRGKAPGYGLYSCGYTLEDLGGSLEVRTPNEGGTEVIMEIPIVKEALT